MNEIRSMHIKYENKDINKFIPYDARNVTEKFLIWSYSIKTII